MEFFKSGCYEFIKNLNEHGVIPIREIPHTYNSEYLKGIVFTSKFGEFAVSDDDKSSLYQFTDIQPGAISMSASKSTDRKPVGITITITKIVNDSIPDGYCQIWWYNNKWNIRLDVSGKKAGGSTLMVVAKNQSDAEDLVQYYYPFSDETTFEYETLLVIHPDINKSPNEAFDDFNKGLLGWVYDDRYVIDGHDAQFWLVPKGGKYGGRAHMIHSHTANNMAKRFMNTNKNAVSYDIIVLYKIGQNITPPNDDVL